MRRLLPTLAGLAIALTPAAGLAATNADMHEDATGPSTPGLSLDLLSLTDFTLNPSEDTWLSLIQQIHAHPCFNAVGEELGWCKEQYGLGADLQTLLGRSDFSDWLHTQMVNAACSGLSSVDWVGCVNRVPVLTAESMASFRASADGSVAPAGQGGPDDMTSTNDSLFARAGSPPTTRQNALKIIAENMMADETTTPYERSKMLWEWCADARMGQTGCFHSFQRFVDDASIDQATVRELIGSNGRSGQHDDRDANDDRDNDGEDDDDDGASVHGSNHSDGMNDDDNDENDGY